MSNKIVLHLTGMKSTKFGGLERYLLEMTRQIAQKGYHSVLQYDYLPKSSSYLIALNKVEAKIVIINTHSGLFQSSLKILRLINALRPEIVLTHFVPNKIRFAVANFARAFGVRKVVAMMHSSAPGRRNSRAKFVFNNFDHVLAVSNEVANKLILRGVNPKIISTHYLGLFGNHKRTTHNRCQLRNAFGIPKEATVLACIAWDKPVKGIDILLDAFQRISDNYPGVQLILLGIDPLRSALPRYAGDLGLTGSVHWAGIRDDIWSILNAADIYIQPSRSEGLPLSILEAMSLKLPVVATPVGGIPEAVVDGETGYLADRADAESLRSAIEKVLAQPLRWKTIGESGYLRYLRQFRGEDSIKTLFETYLEIIQ